MREEVLDHGYCQLVDYWGGDETIIEAARMSTGRGFQGWEKDAKLLRYLWTHKHLTPFEMCGMSVEIQAPIFVAREVFRHRSFSFNELSARYEELPDIFYTPTIGRLMTGKQATKNKQGSEAGFSKEMADSFQLRINEAAEYARDVYKELLEDGLSRELARLVIPMSQYTRWRMSGNLRNWLAFEDLRLGDGVQWETKQYAVAAGNILAQLFPRAWGLFMEGR